MKKCPSVDDAEMSQLWIRKRSHEGVSTLMVRDRKMRSINCPHCGKPMKKHRKKAEYVCRNPRCPVIFVRIHRGIKRVGVEPRLNEHMIVQNMAVRKVREQLKVVLKVK